MKKINTVSIISDTHGIIDNHIISYLQKSDVIIHAGDICSTKIISDLNRYCKQVYLVAGNNDIPENYFNNTEFKEGILFFIIGTLIVLLLEFISTKNEKKE